MEWASSLPMLKDHFISYLKLRKFVSQGCIYHIVLVNYSSVEVASLKSFPIVSKFPEIFHDDIPVVPPEKEIHFLTIEGRCSV